MRECVTPAQEPDQRGKASRGLHDPSFEHDACGFGLIASLDGVPKRRNLDLALDALARMAHRGAVAADGASGDGAGLLIQRPSAWLAACAADIGLSLPAQSASGLVLLPREVAEAQASRQKITAAARESGLIVLGWRRVPLDLSACGPVAEARRPHIEQLFVAPAAPLSAPEFRRALFATRRRAAQALGSEEAGYLVSLSADSIGFKAMVIPERLPRLYPDLRHPALASTCVIVHQRFSTNTAPRWPLAQPFRHLAHNGEINTIAGNRGWARARRTLWKAEGLDFAALGPLVSEHGSDSQSLDDMLEVMLAGGFDALAALRILIPPAAHTLSTLDPDLAAFYEYYALHTEPWDGPAAVSFNDGRYAGCLLDRNGLRPARWARTEDTLVIASEAGAFRLPEGEILAKGRLGPGQMLAVDLERGEVLDSEAIDRINASRHPFKQWLKEGVGYLVSDLIDPALAAEPFDDLTLARFQRRFGLTREERDGILKVLAETEGEAVGSMGDDTPLPAFSQRLRSLYDSFRQAFAQVTNPPIDPLRETVVMSLVTQFGAERNVFEARPEHARQVQLNSPILSQRKLRELLAMPDYAQRHALLHLYCREGEGLEAALRRLVAEAAQAVREGARVLLLSDRYPPDGARAVHALLATGAIHHGLVEAGLRCDCNLVVETGTARDAHHMACLIGMGATFVYPYLAYQTLHGMLRQGQLQLPGDDAEPGRRYRRGLKKGLLKILSKMGISSLSSYRGARLFEIVGLAPEVVALCFPGTPSRIGGAGFAELDADAAEYAAFAADDAAPLEIGGLMQYRPGGEYHMANPEVVLCLQRAVLSEAEADWEAFRRAVDERPPSALRDLFAIEPLGPPVPLEAVEPASAILARFDSAGMSLGALSPEAHEALAIAMNRLGCRSNSGEGGEDPARHGTERRSKIKQVASGRFGVTPGYLVNAEVLQIKIAQGAKPGEGGQLPGHKVDATIARLRHARPGIGLISPPPHHDIYSIEDLAQLIYDLKQVNPTALVSVKLVAHAGVGTIAAGVAKAGADFITVSGHDGGTGASPVSSIRYAGSPWELGLAEAQETLRRNGLRGRVRLQADGGLKTGLDVVKAALLGADSFGFGTVPMMALGCKYLRICHLNTCATGVATQDARLREQHFKGLPERVMAYFRFLAEDVRRHLAALGARSLDELIGRADLLRTREDLPPRQRLLDLSRLVASAALPGPACHQPAPPHPAPPSPLAATLLDEVLPELLAGRSVRREVRIDTQDRSLGAGLSGALARACGDEAPPATLELHCHGSAGQSFGAFNAKGVHLHLHGEANDGVGKGMAGGRIVIAPPAGHRFPAHEAAILGNAALYGATGGELFAAGRAGERFAVRNSGATAVVEGLGDHGCEYMTGGQVLVLGRTGLNFGAGMTGGFAYVLDLDRGFVDRYNHELVDIHRLEAESMEHHLQHLRALLRTHAQFAGSALARGLLEDFREVIGKFWLVKPKAASLDSLVAALKRAA
ncbi:glutamate synthase large subunit [Silanimonas lenta]|uniref:glutamate synthase large subunit n=1 Tax=Silanimonas lenta TaxID=265429 RepID=UPI000684EF87|nr:glutamate synthase large subunit [Silanimonas lenta]